MLSARAEIGGVTWTGLPASMRAKGAGLDHIGYVLLTTPSALKFLWSPIVERYRLPATGRSRLGAMPCRPKRSTPPVCPPLPSAMDRLSLLRNILPDDFPRAGGVIVPAVTRVPVNQSGSRIVMEDPGFHAHACS
jgi:hypothetical protein